MDATDSQLADFLGQYVSQSIRAVVRHPEAEALSRAGQLALAAYLAANPVKHVGYVAASMRLARRRVEDIITSARALQGNVDATYNLTPLGVGSMTTGLALVDALLVDLTDAWEHDVQRVVEWMLCFTRLRPDGCLLILGPEESRLVHYIQFACEDTAPYLRTIPLPAAQAPAPRQLVSVLHPAQPVRHASS